MSDVVPNKNVIKRVCGVCGAGPDISLSRCVQCKSVWYCGKECQKKDWKLHKIACKTLAVPDLEEGKLAVLNVPNELLRPYHRYPALVLEITSSTSGGNSYQLREAYYKCGSMSDPLENSLVFKELPLTTALGYPLLLATCPGRGDPVLNILIGYAGLNPDQKSSKFGQPMLPDLYGGVILVRRDGRHMHRFHILSLLEYARSGLRELFEVAEREAKGETVDRADIAKRLLTPAAATPTFQSLKQAGTTQGNMTWANMECPFEVVESPAGSG
ncbi:hypothetical protein LTR56_005125 [Elasticomyces elasticus]|nr:hypothetical protein LTR56_005125 [Elasticomyces elasticus]KAK3659581.1 hypothetical protein LTR22_008311 [Elasticomyces elasticus]KAK4921283.1 hypothetical protein LTR49_011286 [Elasticomyces elasticus]KAK5759705.1 hypothetical protein LTS12_010222 [Elasticomyces elasticus]